MGTFKDPTLCHCMAYREYQRTKGLAAFIWVEPVQTVKTLNQYCTKTVFFDGSYILTSTHTNKINLNRMIAYTRLKEAIAVRTLFGYFEHPSIKTAKATLKERLTDEQ